MTTTLERECIRGCTQRGVHYATCPSYGTDSGDCGGCAPFRARPGAMVCDRCYGRLRSRIELIPDLVAMLRSLADPRKATVYDRQIVSGSAPEGIPAPVAADILDAQVDLLHAIGAGWIRPGAESDEAYEHALRAARPVLLGYDDVANDRDMFMSWWELVMPAEHETHPEYWTVTRVMLKWPLEDRRRWAAQPCPECGMRTVRINPPRHRHALTWFACSHCGWRKNEHDDDGLWAAAFGLYTDNHDEKENPSMKTNPTPAMHPVLDLGPAVKAGTEYAERLIVVHENAAAEFAAFMVGATPAIAEAFASLAEDVAATARGYEQGALLANGARLVAAAIREAAQDLDADKDAEPAEQVRE